jgi:hypothetical protein
MIVLFKYRAMAEAGKFALSSRSPLPIRQNHSASLTFEARKRMGLPSASGNVLVIIS